MADEVAPLLADLLADMCRALCPDDPGSVVVGPVDLGPPVADPPPRERRR